LTTLLERMKLEHLAAQIGGLCEHAATDDLDYKGFLAQALEIEWRGRDQGSVESRLTQARFPWVKTLEQFDLDFQPFIVRKVLRELAGLSFVERAHNALLLGPPGVGKTRLAIALGVKAVEAGYSVLFLTFESLVTRLVRARHENRLARTLQQLTYPKLVVLDELGHLPLSREEASLFFRLLVRRYERGSLVVTSNKGFTDWGEVFNDQVLATAIPLINGRSRRCRRDHLLDARDPRTLRRPISGRGIFRVLNHGAGGTGFRPFCLPAERAQSMTRLARYNHCLRSAESIMMRPAHQHGRYPLAIFLDTAGHSIVPARSCLYGLRLGRRWRAPGASARESNASVASQVRRTSAERSGLRCTLPR
jgi:DNA replication protein DnaC